jgi:hypothetical protein
LLFLKPAWHCRVWACEGIPVRRFEELNLRQKWIKATLPIRESLIVRSLFALPERLWRYLKYLTYRVPTPLDAHPLPANYETFWMADSDACSSIDLFATYLWFVSRGDLGLSPSTPLQALVGRAQPLIVRKSHAG